jgi:hypothetical protein
MIAPRAVPDSETPQEYIIEQVSPTTQELFLLVNQLSAKWALCYPGSIHSDLCRDALLALSDELLRRRQANEL